MRQGLGTVGTAMEVLQESPPANHHDVQEINERITPVREKSWRGSTVSWNKTLELTLHEGASVGLPGQEIGDCWARQPILSNLVCAESFCEQLANACGVVTSCLGDRRLCVAKRIQDDIGRKDAALHCFPDAFTAKRVRHPSRLADHKKAWCGESRAAQGSSQGRSLQACERSRSLYQLDRRRTRAEELSQERPNIRFRRLTPCVVVVTHAYVEHVLRSRKDPAVSATDCSTKGDAQVVAMTSKLFISLDVDPRRNRARRDTLAHAETLQRFGGCASREKGNACSNRQRLALLATKMAPSTAPSARSAAWRLKPA